MSNTPNPRKSLAEAVFQSLQSYGQPYTVARDLKNPYAVNVTFDGKTYRVITKELKDSE